MQTLKAAGHGCEAGRSSQKVRFVRLLGGSELICLTSYDLERPIGSQLSAAAEGRTTDGR